MIVNLCIGVQPESEEEVKAMSETDQKGVKRMTDFSEKGSDYARYHGTRPATIGLVLSASPLGLLAWYESLILTDMNLPMLTLVGRVGEKFIQWTDKTPPIDDILDSVTLYWVCSFNMAHI